MDIIRSPLCSSYKSRDMEPIAKFGARHSLQRTPLLPPCPSFSDQQVMANAQKLLVVKLMLISSYQRRTKGRVFFPNRPGRSVATFAVPSDFLTILNSLPASTYIEVGWTAAEFTCYRCDKQYSRHPFGSTGLGST